MKSDLDLYYELTYYTLSHPNPAFIHQHVVDAFAAQNADEDTKAITVAFALIGLYLHLQKNYSGKEVQQAHMHLANRRKQWPDFDLPEDRGSFTVSDVVRAPAGPKRDEAIEKWCLAVWEAYRQSHEKVARLVRDYLVDPV